MRPLVLALGVALAGCVAPSGPLPPAAGALPLAVSEGVRVDPAQAAREPAIAVLPDGALVVGGYWGPVRYAERPPGDLANALQTPLLWRSTDGGATWQRLDVGTPLDMALGNSDMDLATDGAGRLFAASLTFNNPLNTIVVGRSADAGATWVWSLVDQGPFVDRPWVRVAPDGTVHLVWNDGRGVHQATSPDGAAWTRGAMVSAAGGGGGFDIGPRGELAVRVVPPSGGGLVPPADVDGVAVSTDGGGSWEFRTLPGARSGWAGPAGGGDGTPRAWDPIAFDAAGALYAAWPEEDTLHLARSTDLGATWDVTPLVREASGRPFYPFLRGGAAGELAATWFLDASGTIAARAAIVRNATAEAPEVRAGTLEPDTGSADHGEYYEVAWLPGGGIAAAVPVLRDGAQWLDFRTAR